MDAAHALDLPLGGKALVETLGAKFPHEIFPWQHNDREDARVALFIPGLKDLPVADDVAENTDEGFERYVAGEHISLVIAPDRMHRVAHRLKIVPHQRVDIIRA